MNREKIKNIGETPIEGDSPVGSDVSYEPNFEEITGELEKLSSPTAEGAVNWQRVAELGVIILRDESKNLIVACYLNVALFYTDGMQGFAVGAHILRNLLETWWDTMYPPKKRKKGRINILNWWDDKLQQLLSEQETVIWPQEQRQQLLDDLDGIDSLIADQLEDGPMLRPLKDAVSRLVDEEAPPPEPEPEPEEAEAAASSEPEEEAAPPQPKEEPAKAAPAEPPKQEQKKPQPSPAPISVPEGDAGDAEVYLRQGLELLGRAATHVFQADASRPLPYQLNRFVAWSELDELPPATNNMTMLPPPNEQVVSILETMFRAENWEDLLEAAESRVREHLFWLDLSYYSFRALKGLGHMLAAQAVENETRLHVLRLTGSESLSFNDERPFASQQTKDWLASAPAVQTGTVSSGFESASDGERKQGVVQDVEEAVRLCAGSGIQEALIWLSEQKKGAGSPRREFMYDVGFCRLLFQADRTDIALSFAENLLIRIDRHKLEQWEPELAAQGLVQICRCLLKTDDGESEGETVQKRKQVAARLALLAPDQMLSLT